ncbi:hypothetical protein Q3G72_031601 [Acer saccharum]|nr:hypothetical protein Q3G72_031601 [Acer saccharum]
MSTSDIVKLCESLSLSDGGKVLQLQEDIKREEVGKLKSQKPLGQEHGHSNSVSEGFMRGNDEGRVGQVPSQSTEGAVSGGSIDRPMTLAEDLPRLMETKESEGVPIVVDDVVPHPVDHPGNMTLGIYDHCVEAQDIGDTSKKSVRTWKRVARGTSSSPRFSDRIQSDNKRKCAAESEDDVIEVKKVKTVEPLSNFLLSAEPGTQAHREP